MTKQEFVDWFFEQKPYWPTPPECYDKIVNSLAGEQQPVTGEQAEWEFLTIIRANRAILENTESKIAFPNHSPKTAALKVYDDMIEIISHLPAKRSGKEKQVADYVNSLPQPPTPEPAGERELTEKENERLKALLERCLPFIEELQAENYNDPSVGIFPDHKLSALYDELKNQKPEPQQNQDE